MSETKKDCVYNNDIADEVTAIAQSYRKKHPDSEESFQMQALIYKQLGMLDKQKEILQQATNQSFAAPRCAIMLADMEFREHNYDQSLQNFQKAIAQSDNMKTAVHDGYLYVMTALCKMASAKQKNAELSKEDVLNIYGDLNAALSYEEGLNETHKDIVAKKASYLISKYDVPVPAKDKKLREFMKELKTQD